MDEGHCPVDRRKKGAAEGAKVGIADLCQQLSFFYLFAGLYHGFKKSGVGGTDGDKVFAFDDPGEVAVVSAVADDLLL